MSKKDFSVALKYVEARPRSQRRKGAEARVSGISVGGSGVSATDLSLLQTNLISVTNNFTALKDLFDSMFEKDSEGNIHAKLSLWSSGGITAGGVGSGGSGGGGGISYNRLDAWSDYSADKAGYVLSALLGKDLDNRVSALANAGYITASYLAPYALRSEIPSLTGYATESFVTSQGYITQSALAPYALRSEIPSLVGYATQGWVGDNYLSKSGGVITGQGDYAYVQLRLSGDIATIGFQQYGVDKGVVGWSGNTGIRLQNLNGYGLAVRDSNDPIYYWGQNGSVQRILLHAGNYADYALSINGGTVNGLVQAPFFSASEWMSARFFTSDIFPVSVNATGMCRWGTFDEVGGLKIQFGADSNAKIEVVNREWNASLFRIDTSGKVWAADTITSPSFFGNLTGNADSATRLLAYKHNSGGYSLISGARTDGTLSRSIYDNGRVLIYSSEGQGVNAEIATIDSNVASATKLQTPRTIWGQSFDGTGDINGAIDVSLVASDLDIPVIKFASDCYFDKYGNYVFGKSAGSFSVFNGSHLNAIFHVLKTGNVAIGAKTADEKLHVHGNGKFTGALTANSLTIGGVTLTYDSVNEALCINGNMYALGGITAGGAGISTYSSLEARVARLEQQLNIS